MKAAALPATPSSPPRQSLRFGSYRFPETAALPPTSLNSVRLRRFRLFRPPRDSSSEVVRGLNFDSGKVSEGEHEWEICITRTLPPALTLEQGLQKIKEAVDKLKMDPPRTSNGMYRFQVPVPPSAKALNWFSCQPESSEVFPQFFLSKETKNPTYKSLRLNRTRGAFGIGIGASFTHSASRASECSLFTINRYLSVDSALTMAYGIMDIDFDTRSSSLKHDTGSYFFFIPQVVLDEHEDRSILALTLSWSESSLCCFEDALCSCESSLKQVGSHFWPISENCNNKFRNSTLKNFNVVEVVPECLTIDQEENNS